MAWAAEKVGRLKLNGQLTQRSPLTPLVELEGMAAGVAGKLRLWQALGEVVDDESLRARFDALAARAERQLADLEPRRLAAARLAARWLGSTSWSDLCRSAAVADARGPSDRSAGRCKPLPHFVCTVAETLRLSRCERSIETLDEPQLTKRRIF